jgi:hypothetical protein
MKYATLREKISAEKNERAARYAQFQELFNRAWEDGMRAAARTVPPVMNVYQGDVLVAVETEGPCGFAWVHVRGAGSSFGRWLTKENLARKAYGGGLDVWISDYGQSMARKEAHARAMAETLRAGGIDCYSGHRMD